MKSESPLHHPVLVPGARYRWDEVRHQHQIVFPEGVLVLNESAAAIVRLCDGRSAEDVIRALCEQMSDTDPSQDVHEFFERLAKKGLMRDAS